MPFGSDETLGITTPASPYTADRLKKPKPLVKPPVVQPTPSLVPAPVVQPAVQTPLPAPSMDVSTVEGTPVTETPITETPVAEPPVDSYGTYGGTTVEEWWAENTWDVQGVNDQHGAIDAEFQKVLDDQMATLAAFGFTDLVFNPNDPWRDTPLTGDNLKQAWAAIKQAWDKKEADHDLILNPADHAPEILRTDEGKLMAMGFWNKGKFYVTKDLRELGGMLDQYKDTEIPTLTDWMEEQGYDFHDVTESAAWSGLQSLIDKLNDPDQQQDWLESGIGQAEQVLGLGEGEYGGTLSGLLEQMNEAQSRDPYQMNALQERDLAGQIATVRDETRMILESLGSQGRGVQAMMAADEISSQIGNLQIQSRLKSAEFNLAKNQADWAQTSGQYNMMVQTGMMSATEYIQRQRENASLQIAQYANEVSMIESANAQYLSQYAMDLTSMQAHAEQIYNAIRLDLDVDSVLLDQMNDYYNMAMAPLVFQLEQAAALAATQAQDAESRRGVWNTVLGVIGMGAAALLGNPALFAASAVATVK